MTKKLVTVGYMWDILLLSITAHAGTKRQSQGLGRALDIHNNEFFLGIIQQMITSQLDVQRAHK